MAENCQMNPDEYFITGYTGFCPDMQDKIGDSYHKATRKTIKVHPHLKTRLSDVHFPQEMLMVSHCNQGDFNCCWPTHSQYVSACQTAPPQTMMYPCYGDGGVCNDSGYPEQAYPLSCSEWGSPCVSKHCNEMYAPCLKRRQSFTCQNYMVPKETCCQTIQQSYSDPKPCCSFCAKGGPCDGDSGGEKSGFKYSRKDCRITLERMVPHRKSGVIPNYMGHIPGMQSSFGEPFGTAADRLLRRHFDELARKGL